MKICVSFFIFRLARPSKCPDNLSIAEFNSFGTLRADGYRSQLFKLYAMIEMEKLSFEKESVLALIMQTLWECGVYDELNANAVRETHIDFLNVNFCSAMLDRLEEYTVQQEMNWMHPLKLLMVTVVVIRIYEINNNTPNNEMIDQMVQLLDKLRANVHTWIDKIENVIHEIKTYDEDCERQLRLKLIYVAVIGCLTFFVHSKHTYFSCILQNNRFSGETAPQQWLHFLITLKSNMEVYTRKEKQSSANLRMFLRLIERIGIDLEASMKQLIARDKDQIHKLVRMQWPRSNHAQFRSVDFHREFNELLMVDTIECGTRQKVSIDIITGQFLVNGLPLSRLPSSILESEVYKWFFGDAAFEVQPDGINSFSTIKTYNNRIYAFRKEHDQIIITERTDSTGIERELIHHSMFKGKFKHLTFHMVPFY